MRWVLLVFIIALFSGSCKEHIDPYQVSVEDSLVFDQASKNAMLASQGFKRCRQFTTAWLDQSDPKTLLIPRNLERDRDIWNAKDAAADNYPFMVLTAFFVDEELFNGRMHDMLASERALTSRVDNLPDTYSFSKEDFQKEEVNYGEIVFGSSEYVKDGLLPLTEWLGSSPWYDRMIELSLRPEPAD